MSHSSAISSQQLNTWRRQINDARCEQQHGLRQQLAKLKKDSSSRMDFEQRLATSLSWVKQRSQNSPAISFPDALPISQRQTEIAKLIKDNQVVILAGETGSGKTTQLPKICLSLGYGNKGLIGHTQPRRIAARTVAERIASELKSTLGDVVGYQVRFSDIASDNTRIKLMTDGVLLAEFQRDRFLSRYEVIIIDEAHERSLNIDFLLGLLKPLCKKRPDLKVIITSATIDLEKFAEHFAMRGKAAPVIEVSGRTYPVDTIYQAQTQDSPALPDVITDTVKQIIRNEAKGIYQANGDILVFCAGEREIRDAATALKRAQLPIEVLPLYSRLSVAEQNKVFQSAHRRKVVLATNVAETSITVPGIAYVIDPGVARISRYSFRSKVQRLPIEAISQASANQRQGRCGRVANGVCIRLYSEDDFNSRPPFTPAEIVRSNLASVILKMQRLGIYDSDQFAFIDHPDKRLLNDGYKLLQELNAIHTAPKKKGQHGLTKVGQQMSDLPVDPRYARILVAAQELECLQDALILISALSIQDPRERPADKQQAADQAHRELAHPQSDFFSYLHLWQSINTHRAALSNSKFKQLCIEKYWSIARVFEWRELYHQLASLCKELGWKTEKWQDLTLAKPTQGKGKKTAAKNDQFDARYERLHRALISGLVSNIATKDLDDHYTAARNRQVFLFPASPQAKRKPKWLVAAQLLETSRLFAHTVAQIKPEWVIDSAQHSCKYTYSAPHYHARSGTVKAQRKTLLYGLVLRDKEKVNYGPINPSEARTLFIRQALVEEQYKANNKHTFFEHNQTLIRDIEKIETKTRRRNLLVSEHTLFEFYAERIPANINNRNSFERWIKQGNDELLKLNRTQLLATQISDSEVAQFPDTIEVHGKTVSIVYKFTPGQTQDGVTMVVPISVLAPFPEHIGDWLVPGVLHEKCVALIKTLPKTIRRNFAPASDAIDRIWPKLNSQNEQQQTPNTPLHHIVAEHLFRTRGVKVSASDFDLQKLDPYYLMNYRIIDTDGSLVDEGRDLLELKQRYANSVQKSVHADHAPERIKLEQHQLHDWSFGKLHDVVNYQHQGMTVTAYPMLKEMPDCSLSLLVSDDQSIAHYESDQAIVKLAYTVLSNGTQRQSAKYLQKELMAIKHKSKSSTQGLSNLAQQLNTVTPKKSDKSEWLEELMMAGLRMSCFDNKPLSIKDKNAFHYALEKGAKDWVSNTLQLEEALLSALRHKDRILNKVNNIDASSIEIDQALEDIKAQLYRLFEPHFLRYTSLTQLTQYSRYLRAIDSRLEKLPFANKQRQEEQRLYELQAGFDNLLLSVQHDANIQERAYVYLNMPQLREFILLLEEWRVSLFAQHLKTQFPVSEKRLTKAWQTIKAT